MTDHTVTETVEQFRERASAWIEQNLPRWDETALSSRELQNRIFDGGFAGIAFPPEYGGAGLTLEHQKAFYDAAAELDRQVPTAYMVSIGMLGPTLLDHGSHEAKLKFLPALLRGDEEWIQLLSEPRGGSDMAGAITRLTRDGDAFILSGAKMWSTGAHHADYGLCLCRTDWDAPKHRGLSMIAVPLKDTPGITIEQTRSASGQAGEFCQEFFDDVVLPAENLIGELNGGWTVAQRLLFHERNAVGNVGYGYLGLMTRRSGDAGSSMFGPPSPTALAQAAERRGVSDAVRNLAVDAYIQSIVGPLTSARIMTGMRVGTHQGQWGSLLKLQSSVGGHETIRAALAVLGAEAVMWDGDDVQLDNLGTMWLGSRGSTIAGGTSEMQRNIISERLLGLPREPSSDRDVPFNEVIRNLGKS
jgi:alkylation response protein AidB-like acyl-CoA dehydrogenase